MHAAAAVLHVVTWHALGVGHMTGVVPSQTPALQDPCVLHAPFMHACPSNQCGGVSEVHVPVSGLHSLVNEQGAVVQVTEGLPAHAPAVHSSPLVHASPSSHAVPSAAGFPWQTPPAQVSPTVQASPSSQGAPSAAPSHTAA
jgi:hypothetical protein